MIVHIVPGHSFDSLAIDNFSLELRKLFIFPVLPQVLFLFDKSYEILAGFVN